MPLRQFNHLVRNHPHIVRRIRVAWILFVLWFEIGVFHWSLLGCKWPDSIWKKSPTMTPKPAHLLVIADTQVLDAHSLRSVPHRLRACVTFVVESNMRKNWRAVSWLKPDGFVFLGDMINGGRYAHDAEEYDRFANKFHDLFQTNVPTYYVVGNHDVGLGHSSAFSHRARARYQYSFNVSDPNQLVIFGNHSLVLLDAPGLVEEDYRRVNADKVFVPLPVSTKKVSKPKAVWTPTRGGSVEFVRRVAHDHDDALPVILFSHIPLARPERASCGPLREGIGENSRIQRGAGSGYQNLLSKTTSTLLLEELKPQAIFSADDHDYCEFVHSYLPSAEEESNTVDTVRKIKETSVKAFSMAAGIRRPGVQLLSFWNPVHHDDDHGVPSPSYLSNSGHTFTDRPCLLPDQMKIYTHGYLPLILLTSLLLAWLNGTNRPLKSKLTSSYSHSPSHFTTPKAQRHSVIEEDNDVTPKAAALEGNANLISRGATSRAGSMLIPNGSSGLRTPVSGASSPGASPRQRPPQLLPDNDRLEEGDSHTRDDERNPKLENDGGWRSSIGGSSVFDRRETRSSVGSIFGTKKIETGDWKRGSTRSLFGLGSQAGVIGLGIGETEREREKRLERKDSRASFSMSSSLGRATSLGKVIKKTTKSAVRSMKELVLGRPKIGGFWKRLVWDALVVAFPSWITFALITWWIMN